MKTYLQNSAKKINIVLTEEQNEQLFLYKELLLEWNKKINLTSITEDNEIILKHFVDSMTIEKYIPKNCSLIDVGTGAGFPGIVIKIIRPDLKITLLDSLNKRINFLNDVILKCKLSDIETIHGRAEDIAKDSNFREKYDIATARAVANLSTLSEYCIPFVKVGGYFIAMKGTMSEEFENGKKAIHLLGGDIERIDSFQLPETNIDRNIVLVKKIKSTSNLYPRKAGIPSEKPL